jgi:hypothetical protein
LAFFKLEGMGRYTSQPGRYTSGGFVGHDDELEEAAVFLAVKVNTSCLNIQIRRTFPG